jgi:GNAT superfamily N-acetyltransferase
MDMLMDLHAAVAKDETRGDISTPVWDLSWRAHDRRIEDKVRANVFTIHSIHIKRPYRGKGHFTELLKHLDFAPEIGLRRFEWIYMEQVNFRLAGHLERVLHYNSDFGMIIDCWRRVTGQAEMNL